MKSLMADIQAGQRINGDEWLRLAREANLHQLGLLAHRIRQRLHPEPVVTYVVDRNINYTDVCISACSFCAYFKTPQSGCGQVLSFEELGEKITETQALGGTQILLQGGLHPDKELNFYVDMLRFIKQSGIHIHGFSPPEICHIASLSGLSTLETIKHLIEAGLDSIPGGGAEILSNRVRRLLAPKKCGADAWIRVMREAHGLGLRSSATMMFGHVETMEERLEHLQRIRDLQDETQGFTAFIPWPFQPDNTALAQQAAIKKTSAVEYLRMLALSRIFLDNIDNLQASWVTQGAKIAQISLFFGANDFGSTMIEENVVAAAGVRFRLSEDEIRRLVKDAGFHPQKRLMDYRPC